jgi:hypothetical protein
LRHRCILCRCGRCLRPQFPFGVQPVIDVVAIPATSRAVQLERPAGDGVISRLGCRVGSDARLPIGTVSTLSAFRLADLVIIPSPITFAWTLLFPDFSLRGGGERFWHDSAGFVSYCFALCRWTPPKKREEWTRVRRSDMTRARRNVWNGARGLETVPDERSRLCDVVPGVQAPSSPYLRSRPYSCVRVMPSRRAAFALFQPLS